MKRIILGALCCTLLGTALPTLARDLTPPEKKVIMDVVNDQLKDPESAKYHWQADQGGEIYCAHVNSKNSYGGYAGKTPILMDVERDARGRINSAQGGILSDSLSDHICTDAGYKI
ncbi:hypothetical protein [Hafnia alvei]|uniref:hypothetical protein n=1 Tax=Hafnia alvei TaxID=569 RepID=UPI0006216B07|nr:hypothetical protein [Hafnia alvei]KKI45205.1 hypothetical protein XK86_08995 [Hafnia alvei]MDU7480828.1 hypothetical protein [Hafnia alvei]